jgi:hypothetical protein
MFPLSRPVYIGISSPALIRCISRAAYYLWAGPSSEVHVIPVIRCSKHFRFKRTARTTMNTLTLKVPKKLTTKVRNWVGPFDWAIQNPSVLPLVDKATPFLDVALRKATKRKVPMPQVYGMNQEVWVEEWLEL